MEIQCNEDVMEFYLKEKNIPRRFKSFRDLCVYVADTDLPFEDLSERAFKIGSNTVTHKNITSAMMLMIISTLRYRRVYRTKIDEYFKGANEIMATL